MSDPVNAPAHYKIDGLECIDAIRAVLGADGFVAFCHGQVLRYIWRAGHKGDGKYIEDMKKANWYAQMCVGDDPRDRNPE